MTTIISYLGQVLRYLIWLYSIVMVIDAIMSWVPAMRDSRAGQLINRIVDPYVSWFRQGPIERLSNSTGIDISFLIAILVLYFIQDYVLNWIFNILFRLFA